MPEQTIPIMFSVFVDNDNPIMLMLYFQFIDLIRLLLLKPIIPGSNVYLSLQFMILTQKNQQNSSWSKLSMNHKKNEQSLELCVIFSTLIKQGYYNLIQVKSLYCYCLIDFVQTINVMSINKTSSKHLRYQSPIKSPRHAMIKSQQTINDKNLESKLNQKIRKLKNALQATQAHNQQLHVKLKQYKVIKQEEISSLQQQIKNYKKKLQLLEKEHGQAATKLKNKANQQARPGLGKFTSQNKYRQLELQCKNKDMKVIQLEGVIKDLNLSIKQRQQKIQSLESQIDKKKLQDELHEQRKLQKIQSQLKTKVVQSFQHNKQILRLKQSLKDSLKKLQKANEKIYEQGEKIKILEQQNKQSRKIVDGMQKQSIGIRQSSQKQKSQLLQKIEQVRKIQKTSMEHQFNCKRLTQKLNQTTEQHRKLQQQFKSLLVQYQSVSSKYQEIVTSQYDLQRDFQKQLHTIVKQLTRRHIVSKSMISSSNNGSRIFTSPAKQQQVRPHELN